MLSNKMDLIEKCLKLKKVKDYEIYLVDRKAYESIFLKDNIDNERIVNDFEYVLRILTQKENETGVGIVKGNSLDSKEIERNIETCILYANNNLSSKFYFPNKASIPNVSISDQKVVQDPLEVKKDLVGELINEIKQQKDVFPTFGRFRVHIDKISLRNSNLVDLDALKTYFFIEFSLKAQEKGKLAEYWPFFYIKERNDLNLTKRVSEWAKLARDTLNAKSPKPEKRTTVVFSPRVLLDAINPVVGTHASGKAFHEKISLFQIGEQAASENLTVIDDGLLKGGLSSNGWDGEGSPRQRNTIINNGIFQKHLYDQKYAILGNEQSTGNGNRTEQGAIINGISNFEILPGDMAFDEIITSIDDGYYILQFAWLNPSIVSGDFGSEIRNGYYIKDG
ncbi:MAG: TldD/PmbA family protein, partial [Promethearchaeota archaeon]